MKTLSFAALCALILLSVPAKAEQTTATSLCQNGAAVAACPTGVQSNTNLNWGTSNSVAPSQANGATSVANTRNDNRSVGVSPSFNNGDSVAQIQNHSTTSVAYSGGASSNSVSVSSSGGGGSGSVAYGGR
jgi:hypothetical protein